MQKRSITYVGYSGQTITIPDLDVRPEGAEMYSPGGIIITATVAQGLPLMVQAIIHADGHTVVRGYERDAYDNTYWHAHQFPHDAPATPDQIRTIWRLWANLETIGPHANGVGQTLVDIALAAEPMTHAKVCAKYFEGNQVALA